MPDETAPGPAPVQKFRPREVIEAMQWTGSNSHAIRQWLLASGAFEHLSLSTGDDMLVLHIGTGEESGAVGDWVTADWAGTWSVVPEGEFAETYEPVPLPFGETGPTRPCGCGPDEPCEEHADKTPPGRLARVEVKGFRDLGVVRVTETTFAGEAMVHAERTPWSKPDFKGDAADFPASSLDFVTWLPERMLQPAADERPALPAGDPWAGTEERDGDLDEDDGQEEMAF